MKKIIYEDFEEIKKSRRNLEEALGVKIEIQGKEITLEGSAEDEYMAEKVLDAISFGFSISKALMIKKEDLMFEILDIKDYTNKRDFPRIKARIIGTKGKTLKTLSTLTQCYFKLKDNDVGIIGSAELIKNAQDAVIFLIQGSKQSNVYSFLEKHRFKPVIDLGLKEKKKRKRLKNNL